MKFSALQDTYTEGTEGEFGKDMKVKALEDTCTEGTKGENEKDMFARRQDRDMQQ
jgi:hypothetical protein